MRIRLRAAAAAILLASFALGAQAESLRCGNKLISQGDPAAKLLHYCGKPDSLTSWVEPHAVFWYGRYLPGFLQDVVVENWTYNFGPHRLMRVVRIENGTVENIEPLGYGYREQPE